MLWWQTIFLGVVQGVTEFIPVSSDGHLVLAQKLLGINDLPVTFDIFLHAGTLLATIIFFWKELRTLVLREWMIIAAANIPVMSLGFVLRPHLETLADSSIIVAGSFVMTALFLLIADMVWYRPLRTPISRFNGAWETLERLWNRTVRQEEPNISLLQAGCIGLLQSLALLPGVSRSGSTLLGGAVVGLSRDRAFSFAFLLGIPAITAAVFFDVVLILNGNISQDQAWGMYLLGSVSAGIVGWISLSILRIIMGKSRLIWFSIYCLVVSILSLFIV